MRLVDLVHSPQAEEKAEQEREQQLFFLNLVADPADMLSARPRTIPLIHRSANRVNCTNRAPRPATVHTLSSSSFSSCS